MVRNVCAISLVLILTAGMVWAQCGSCSTETESTHACCQKHKPGSCGMPTQKQHSDAKCPNLALVPPAQQVIQIDVAQLVSPVVIASVEAPIFASVAPAEQDPVVHAPPDLYLLNSTLLV